MSYQASICNGARESAGIPDAEGKFNISGQDLLGCTIEVTLTGAGYAETIWSADIGLRSPYGANKSGIRCPAAGDPAPPRPRSDHSHRKSPWRSGRSGSGVERRII